MPLDEAVGGGFGTGAGDPPAGNDVSLILDAHRSADGTRFQVALGWATPRVDHLEIRMEDGWTATVDPIDGTPAGDGLIFAFIPQGMGAAVPLTADGVELEPWPLCVGGGAASPPTCPDWFQS